MRLGHGRPLPAVAAVLLAGALLASCSSNGGVQSNAPVASAQKEAEPSSSNDDKTPIKLNWFVALDWYKRDWNPGVNLMDKQLLDDLGIEINFTSGSPDKLSAMIATGDIPDLITLESNTPQRAILEKSGYILPMDDLLAKHAPEFNVPDSIQNWFRAEDGHYYGLPSYFKAPESMKPDNFLPTHTTMRVRHDLLTQLGIDPASFGTKNGTLGALRKVRDAKLKYNGFDVVPAYFTYEHLVQFFGAKREDDQGRYVDSFREPESLETFQFLNQLYREGLMPQDALTLTRPQVQEKVNGGGVFMYTNWLVKWNALVSQDPAAYYVPAGPIQGDSGKPFHLTPSTVSGWTLTMAGKSTKHEARIAKMLEYYGQDEKSIEVQYGPKGIAWDYDAEGHVKFSKERVEDYAKDADAAALKYAGFDWFTNWMPIQSAFPVPETAFDKWEAETEKYFSQYSYNTMPFEAIKPEGGTDLAAIEIKIADYRKSMEAKMVLAKSPEDVKRLFDSMTEQEEKLGYGELYAYWNEQFVATKEKLGMKFAWPGNGT
ncbi:extracellular solute-binding protein [Paenibacillus pasadenensis]|uniref:extracellular solute-binding protein n=1 Tax=Paenibacillus pasadenensis TaxID=217090 RepID=UPI002040EF53|nr:extracellular solute-binding protein [Paenibacillus pasadenensis]MCM3747021.1 extracellular solute-binding protein [Paenibacillus pasadenensis]